MQRVFAAGKLKHRDKYSTDDEDLTVAGGPIKVFGLVSGDVLETLEGPKEEVTDLQLITYKGDPYIIACSQDGYIWKYLLNRDYRYD